MFLFAQGYKLTEGDMKVMKDANANIDGDDEDDDNFDYTDNSSVVIRRMVDARVSEFTDMRSDVNQNETREQTLQHSKFVTHISTDDGSNSSNTNNNGTDDDLKGDCEDEYGNGQSSSGRSSKTKKKVYYSSGHMFFYTLKAKNSVNISHPVVNDNVLFSDFYVEKKFPDLKTSVLKNSAQSIPIEAWKETLAKALLFVDSKRVKEIEKLSVKYYSFDFTGYFTNAEEPTVEHILCILFYCNFTALSYEFTRTFRLLWGKETRDMLKERHSLFANWGDLLQQTVQMFSTTFPNSKIKIFYHGVSQEMLFDGAYARFNSPTSTSTSLVFIFSDCIFDIMCVS